MVRSSLAIVLHVILAVLLTAVPAACSGAAKFCPSCGRRECRNLTVEIRLEDGSEVRTCCPRCALHYLADRRPAVASLTVRDFDTAGRIDAARAIYVEGSDVAPCAATAGPPPRDPQGCCTKTVYDRCLPSVLAFASRAEAESFARDHGGTVKTLDALRASTR